jgi:hypothetical protein
MVNTSSVKLDPIRHSLKSSGRIMKRVKLDRSKFRDYELSYAIQNWVNKVANISKSQVDWHFNYDNTASEILFKALGDIALVELTIDELDSEFEEIKIMFPNILE